MAPQRARLTLEQLCSYDDIITDALVDHAFYWTNIRKNRSAYHSCRGIREGEVTAILQQAVIVEKSPGKAEGQLLALPGLKKFSDKLKSDKEREDFRRHLRKYINIYLPDCPFEVSSTNRYTVSTHEAAIAARRTIKKGEVVKYLSGIQVIMTPEEETQIASTRRDFSIVVSSRNKSASLFLGPARFANHDCSANARLMTSGKEGMDIIAIRDITVGEEITVTYGDSYFGEDNCECLCRSCELGACNGWSRPKDDPSILKPSIESQTADDLIKKEKSYRLRGHRGLESARRESSNISPRCTPEVNIRPVVSKLRGKKGKSLLNHEDRDATDEAEVNSDILGLEPSHGEKRKRGSTNDIAETSAPKSKVARYDDMDANFEGNSNQSHTTTMNSEINRKRKRGEEESEQMKDEHPTPSKRHKLSLSDILNPEDQQAAQPGCDISQPTQSSAYLQFQEWATQHSRDAPMQQVHKVEPAIIHHSSPDHSATGVTQQQVHKVEPANPPHPPVNFSSIDTSALQQVHKVETAQGLATPYSSSDQPVNMTSQQVHKVETAQGLATPNPSLNRSSAGISSLQVHKVETAIGIPDLNSSFESSSVKLEDSITVHGPIFTHDSSPGISSSESRQNSSTPITDGDDGTEITPPPLEDDTIIVGPGARSATSFEIEDKKAGSDTWKNTSTEELIEQRDSDLPSPDTELPSGVRRGRPPNRQRGRPKVIQNNDGKIGKKALPADPLRQAESGESILIGDSTRAGHPAFLNVQAPTSSSNDYDQNLEGSKQVTISADDVPQVKGSRKYRKRGAPPPTTDIDHAPAIRIPGDYVFTPVLLGEPASAWINCKICEEPFVQKDAYFTRSSCPRCERHSKLYGYMWPKTEKTDKRDTEERILDHRTVHRFLNPEEEKIVRRRGRESGSASPLPESRAATEEAPPARSKKQSVRSARQAAIDEKKNTKKGKKAEQKPTSKGERKSARQRTATRKAI